MLSQKPLTMSKLHPAGKSRKLTVLGNAELGEAVAKYPNVAKVLSNPQKATMLNNLLQGAKVLEIEEQVSVKLKEVVQRLDCLRTMEEIVSRRSPAAALKANTAQRLMSEHPTLGTYMMQFLGEAVGYEELLQQLVTHYNFESLEPGDINDLIYRVEEMRTAFRGLASIQKEQPATRSAA